MTLQPLSRPHATPGYSPQQDVWFPSSLLRDEALADYLESAELLRSKQYSAEEWRRYRTKRLRETLAAVMENSPFHRERFGDLDAGGVLPECLVRLPYMTKAVLQRQGHATYSRAFAFGGVCYPTDHCGRGPVVAPSSWFELLASSLGLATHLADAITRHVLPAEPVAAVLIQADQDCLADGYCDALRNLGVAHIRGWSAAAPGGVQRWREMLLDVGANIVIAAPSTLAALWSYERQLERDKLSAGPLKLLLVAGNMPNRALLYRLTTAYGGIACLPLAYGSAETLLVASSCGVGSMHVAMQNFVTEVVDLETGEPAIAGAPGELVLTSLLPAIRPLVRYRTEDVVSIRPSNCACGSKADVLVNYGRISDIVTINGRRWYSKELAETFVRITHYMHDFRISLGKHDGCDVLHVEIGHSFACDVRFVESALGSHFRTTVKILQTTIGAPENA